MLTSELTTTFASLVTNTLSRKPCPIPLGPAQASALTALRAVSVTEVQQLLESINSNSATGSDNTPLLKTCARHLAPSVALLFNDSLCMGQVPACFEHASVVPIYKKGDRSLAPNYRPTSLLPSLSKIAERLILTQLSHLVSQNPGNMILPPEQFALRANHYCEDLAICVNDWQRALDRDRSVAITPLDLSKAFDSAPHDKLLLELKACGIGANALKWFHSYLSNRFQAVKAPQQLSGPSYPCTQGVPQGSVLGPFLFTVYVRMLPSVVINNRSPLFADDINLYNNGPDLPVVIAELQQDVNRVHDFLNERCLHLNASKTEFMILHRSPVDLNQHTLTVGNSTVSPWSSAMYLGLTIDSRLTLSRHIDLLVGKIAGKLKTFQRARISLDNRARRSFYISPIQTSLL